MKPPAPVPETNPRDRVNGCSLCRSQLDPPQIDRLPTLRVAGTDIEYLLPGLLDPGLAEVQRAEVGPAAGSRRLPRELLPGGIDHEFGVGMNRCYSSRVTENLPGLSTFSVQDDPFVSSSQKPMFGWPPLGLDLDLIAVEIGIVRLQHEVALGIGRHRDNDLGNRRRLEVLAGDFQAQVYCRNRLARAP